MSKLKETLGSLIEHVLPWFVLAILLFYSSAKFFEHPYHGFKLDSNGQIINVYVIGEEKPVLEAGDRVIKIGSLLWEDYKKDLRKRLFDGVQPGQEITLEIEHAGELRTVSWKFPGPNPREIFDLLFSEGWLTFAFWFIGSMTLFILRPKDERWRLLIGFNYLTAIWLAAGSGVSFYHIWNSAIVLRMAVWLCVPVYLFLNWVFPKPLGRRPRILVWVSYLVAIAFAIAEWFQILPTNLYFIGFVLAIVGSIVLFIVHAVWQAEVRRDLLLVLVAGLLSLLPVMLTGLMNVFGLQSVSTSVGLISLPFLPFAYFYAAYRHQLGDFEIRVNRLVSIYVFVTLVCVILLPLIMLVLWLPSPEVAILTGLTASFLAAIVSIAGFPRFRSFVERRLLGIRVSFEKLQESYAARIVTSTSVAELGNLLQDEVLPSLQVKQFVFLQQGSNFSEVILAVGMTPSQVPGYSELPNLLERSGKYYSSSPSRMEESIAWIRLVIPLQIGNRLIGLWLFGRRDPDDVYSQVEIPSLQALANQTAIALSYIVQTEQIKKMYQANIDRHEDERLRLALDLHDGVLNQIAAILMKLDTSPLSSASEVTYGVLIDRLRGIISNLRPPMLGYGLKPALDELAGQLMEHAEDDLNVIVDIDTETELSYSPNFEQHLYRIVQETCQNSLKHGRATEIYISGRLGHQHVDLKIKDNGVGFDAKALELDTMIANQHFGLAGLVQRAALIGAEVSVTSAPGAGTQVLITWRPGETDVSPKYPT